MASRYRHAEDRPLSSINFGQRQETERNKKACKEMSKGLPDNAFSDDVTDEDVGTYYSRATELLSNHLEH